MRERRCTHKVDEDDSGELVRVRDDARGLVFAHNEVDETHETQVDQAQALEPGIATRPLEVVVHLRVSSADGGTVEHHVFDHAARTMENAEP